MPVVYSYSYNKGLKKEKNEDAINVSKNKKGNILSVICDGVSSHKESSFSSNYIVKELTKSWKNTIFKEYDDSKKWLIENIVKLNEDIIKKSKIKNNKMGTTIVATIIFDDKLLVVNVGDSLTYGITYDKKMELLSVDDSFVGVLLDAGVITKEEAKVHPKRHTLTQAIGVNEKINIHISERNIENFNYILSCSDGLTTMLEEEEIINIIFSEDLSESINKLIFEANKKGGIDNISVSIFKILRGENYDR